MATTTLPKAGKHEAADLRKIAAERCHGGPGAPKDVSVLLLEIANSAKQANDLVNLCSTGLDLDQALALLNASSIALTRIGWMADLAMEKFGELGVLGDAEEWMLPPQYHREKGGV